MRPRSRPVYAILMLLTIVLGLGARKYAFALPVWLSKSAGDVLYATMAFWCVGFLRPALSGVRAAVVTVLFCFLIEFSQIYHALWIDSLRHTMPGGLILGYGFHASDLLCYLIGAAFGFAIERWFIAPQRHTEQQRADKR